MHKATLLKLGGFVTALCATGALVAITVPATGAYFSSSHAGTVQGTSGHLKLHVNGYADDQTTALSLTDLTPGAKTPQRLTYTIDESAGTTADVWLVFDKSSIQFGDLTGKKGTGTDVSVPPDSVGDGGLGRWGYFAVAADGNTLFHSGNLAYAASLDNTYVGHTPYSASSAGFTCSVDANGRGGGDWANVELVMPPSGGSTGPACGIPDKILLANGVSTGFSSAVDLTLGLNIAYATQDAPVIVSGAVPFKIIAVQSGLGVAPSF